MEYPAAGRRRRRFLCRASPKKKDTVMAHKFRVLTGAAQDSSGDKTGDMSLTEAKKGAGRRTEGRQLPFLNWQSYF